MGSNGRRTDARLTATAFLTLSPLAVAPSASSTVCVRDLCYRWSLRESDVLDIAELTVDGGERVFIEGPSGSGKTTLLSLLAGIVTPSRGTISVLGTDLGGLSGAQRDAFRSRHIGFVFQNYNLIPYLSLIDNVLLSCRFSIERRRTIEKQGRRPIDEARRLLQHLNLDVEALAKRPVTRLSAGQQQRVAVARALIGHPDLVICDEPTSALDADARWSFLDLLFREVAAAGATLVFVSHDRTLAAGFDRTVVLPAVNRAWRPTEP